MKILIVLLSSLTMLLLAGCVAIERDIAQERVSESPIAVDVPEDVVEQESSRTSRDKMEELFETISCELERFASYLRDNDLLNRFASSGIIFAENERDATLSGAGRVGVFGGEIPSDGALARRIKERPELMDIVREICERGIIKEIRIWSRLEEPVRIDFYICSEHVTFLFPTDMPTNFFTPVNFQYHENPPRVPGEENRFFFGDDTHIRDNWFWFKIPLNITPS